jgi:phosphohistidine swiveling domain-containing protein
MTKTSKQVLDSALKYKWELWLKRNFYAFMMSLLTGSASKQAFKKIGLNGWELKSFVFTEGHWYWSDEIFDAVVPTLKDWLKVHQVNEISDSLEIFYKKSRIQIINLCQDKNIPLKKKLLILDNIFHKTGSYIWSAHMLEHVLWNEMKIKTAKYILTDIDKYIGDAAYPDKKNSLELMEDEMRSGVDLKIIRKKYSWMRARDGFSRPYSLQELAEHKANLKKHKIHIYPEIPKPLISIYREARELVYLRTRRTDVFYELIFLSRPILKEAAKKYGISFQNLKYYQFSDLISGKPKKYSSNMSCIDYEGKVCMMDGNIFASKNINEDVSEIKGMTAQLGCVKGIAKVVLSVKEVSKVQKGDILVTYMTSPDFLQAMKKASAFVTNEGGLTCHAAIIARELKTPCIIGTKIATKVIKDGDLIEVDANHGIVKILKR